MSTTPLVRFEGEPRFLNRAYMLDVSRGRVPRRDTLAWLLGVLSRLRYTELQLYVEHTYTYPGHDVVWRDASPVTRQDFQWLRDRAADLGIDLVANLNCFGHMEQWLRHPQYRSLAECPEGYPAPFGDGAKDGSGGGVAKPSCLAPTEENADFALSLVRSLLDAVGGQRVMIGGDEPFELGLGRSKAEAERIGRGQVYRNHLARIARPLVADGVEVMIWGDQFRRDPAAAEDITHAVADGGHAGVTVVPWNYEAPGRSWAEVLTPRMTSALGLPEDADLGAEAHVRVVADAGVPFWVAAGTGTWTTLIGRNANAAANITDMATVGSARGASGFLLCDWGDLGHWQPLVVSLPSLVRGAAAAWYGGQSEVEIDVGAVIDDLLEAEPGTGTVLDELGHLGEGLGPVTPNSTPLGAAVFPVPFPTLGELDPAAVASALARLESIEGSWAPALPATERGAVIAAELEAVCGAARLALRRLRGRMPSPGYLAQVRAAQRVAWLGSSRPGGLQESLSYLR